MKVEREIVGSKVFGPKIEITDPCYDHSVWCRMNDVEIVPGTYDCVVDIADEGVWGHRVAHIMIFHESIGDAIWDEVISEMSPIGDIGVDAGLAGFFENKPDYTDEEWHDFCNAIEKGQCWIFDEGFFSSSGYGDGGYTVWAAYDRNGTINALEIEFIRDDEDDDDYDDAYVDDEDYDGEE